MRNVWNIVDEVTKYLNTAGIGIDTPCEKCLPKVEAELTNEFAVVIAKFRSTGQDLKFETEGEAYKFIAREISSGYSDAVKTMAAANTIGCCGDIFVKIHVAIHGGVDGTGSKLR